MNLNKTTHKKHKIILFGVIMSQNRKNTLNTMKIIPFSVLSDLILSYMRLFNFLIKEK